MKVNDEGSAFFVYGNVSNSQGGYSFAVCRFNHLTLDSEWISWLADMIFQDITAGGEYVFVSARLATSAHTSSYKTFLLDAISGMVQIVSRSMLDFNSFPTVLPRDVFPNGLCQHSFVMQLSGNLTALCAEYVETSHHVAWVAPYRCDGHPTINNNHDEHIICTSSALVVNLDFDGTLLWQEPRISPRYPAQVIDDVVWATDRDGTVYGLSLTPSATPIPSPAAPVPANSSPLAGGEVALIIVVMLFCCGLIAGVAYAWRKRSKRRQAYKAASGDSDGYGSLTTA